MTLKTGDKIKIVNTPYGSPQLANGVTGVVQSTLFNPNIQLDIACVAVDNGYKDLDGENLWGFPFDTIEVIG